MRVIARPMFAEAARLYPNDRIAIMDLYKGLKKGDFDNPGDLKNVFGSLDNFKHVDKWYVIDIGGNNLRFIGRFEFVGNVVYAKYILTHSEYDKLDDKYKSK